MRSLGIVSGKGGVGKSLVAVNLAREIARGEASRRVLLVDADAGLANADLMLGWIPTATLSDWIEGRAPETELLTRDEDGLGLLVSGTSEAATGLLARLAARTLDAQAEQALGDADLTVFDLGAGIGAAVLETAAACDRVWLVATPEPTSLADAYTMARRLVDRRPGVDLELIVNRARDAEEGARTHLALDRMTRRFLNRPLPLRAVLPEDPAVVAAIGRQAPLAAAVPHAPIARRMALLAESVADELVPAAAPSRRPAHVPA
ncbi:MAG: P-loop NTPase [Myxococcota bacterium]